MVPTDFVALRGTHSFHMVDRQTIKEVEVGVQHSRIITPYNVIEVENRYNVDALSSICEEPLPEMAYARQETQNTLYPRLSDLPF